VLLCPEGESQQVPLVVRLLDLNTLAALPPADGGYASARHPPNRTHTRAILCQGPGLGLVGHSYLAGWSVSALAEVNLGGRLEEKGTH